MIKIEENKIFRGGEKIGWFEGNHLFEHSGKLLGFFEGGKIYDHDGKEVGHLKGNHLELPRDDKFIRLEDIAQNITGGTQDDLARSAIRIFLGE